mmetsp:Transcript_29875/g.67577  ORF Transcript_29875/g.67577 Transcript_29875/m.67577 type:complete len:314 (-) Transcript_29875:2113-3054(-)
MGGDVGAGGGGDCLVGPVDCRHLHLHLDAMGQPIEAAGSRETAGGGEEVREGLEADGGGVPCKEAESVHPPILPAHRRPPQLPDCLHTGTRTPRHVLTRRCVNYDARAGGQLGVSWEPWVFEDDDVNIVFRVWVPCPHSEVHLLPHQGPEDCSAVAHAVFVLSEERRVEEVGRVAKKDRRALEVDGVAAEGGVVETPSPVDRLVVCGKEARDARGDELTVKIFARKPSRRLGVGLGDDRRISSPSLPILDAHVEVDQSSPAILVVGVQEACWALVTGGGGMVGIGRESVDGGVEEEDVGAVSVIEQHELDCLP